MLEKFDLRRTNLVNMSKPRLVFKTQEKTFDVRRNKSDPSERLLIVKWYTRVLLITTDEQSAFTKMRYIFLDQMDTQLSLKKNKLMVKNGYISTHVFMFLHLRKKTHGIIKCKPHLEKC